LRKEERELVLHLLSKITRATDPEKIFAKTQKGGGVGQVNAAGEGRVK